MRPKTLAKLAMSALEDLKATDIVLLDVKKRTSIADYMVIASGRSPRQVQAMAEKVVEVARDAGLRPMGVEGQRSGDWVLVDLGDVIVHAMVPAARDFYQLEKLWGSRKQRLEAFEQRAASSTP